MGLGSAIWTLDDVQTVADNGLSPARRRGMTDSILARLGHPETADALQRSSSKQWSLWVPRGPGPVRTRRAQRVLWTCCLGLQTDIFRSPRRLGL
jgi:hypothetical protein